MNTKTRSFAISVLLLGLLCMAVKDYAVAEAKQDNGFISYGWVNRAQLSDLSPTSVRQPYDQLLEKKFAQAIVGLKAERVSDPSSLAAYVGLVQADPELRQQEIRRLQPQADNPKATATELFQLGTALLYQSGQTMPPNRAMLGQSQTMLGRAWQREHKPIYGLMLGDALHFGTVSADALLKGRSSKTINEQLVKELAGDNVYQQYLAAAQKGWQVQPPPVALVPAANRKTLLAVVASMRSYAASPSTTTHMTAEGVTLSFNAASNLYASKQRYMAAWFDALVAATQGT